MADRNGEFSSCKQVAIVGDFLYSWFFIKSYLVHNKSHIVCRLYCVYLFNCQVVYKTFFKPETVFGQELCQSQPAEGHQVPNCDDAIFFYRLCSSQPGSLRWHS